MKVDRIENVKVFAGKFAVMHTGKMEYKVVDKETLEVRSVRGNLSQAFGDARWFYQENLEGPNDYQD